MNRKHRGVVVGLPYYAKFLAGLVNEYSNDWHLQSFTEKRGETIRALLALRNADALISFGGPGPNAALTAAAKAYGVPVFVIWAGSDVIAAHKDPNDVHLVKQEGFTHLSDGPWLVDELAVLGLRAEYEPITAVRPGGPIQPLPAKFRVLTYLPEPRRDFYGAALTYEVARRMPDVEFAVCGAGGSTPDAPANVTFLGYVNDVERRIDESTVLLRVPNHDGKSMFVLEALSRGRHVVWNYEFPHVHTARTAEQVLQTLQELQRTHARGDLRLNENGRAFVLQRFSRKDTARRFVARLELGVRQRTALRTRKRRVAISGLPLFCAQVAACTKDAVPHWDPSLLRTGSRLEVFTAIVTLMTCDVWYSIGTPITDRWLYLAALLLRKPRVIHWVGSDLAGIKKQPRLQRALRGPGIVHLAEVGWMAEQLRALGLNARIAPLPPRQHGDRECPMPADFTVMLYVPRTRAEFYGRRAFEQLMERLRDRPIRYIVVGGGDIDVPPGVAVENLGWRDDLMSVYERVSALIRYTATDGLSLMVLEALTFGRHVLWTQEFPFTHTVRRYEDMEREIVRLFDAHQRGELRPQCEAADAIRKHYDSAACIKAIASYWEDALEKPASARLALDPS